MFADLAPPAPAREDQATVLVVDDEPRNVEMLSDFLTLHGLRVVTAEDGEQALEVTYREMPDVILLDVVMPRLQGFDVCRRLKSDPATVFIPVVIVTGLRGQKERIRGAEAGADEFISKPYDQTELITRLRSLLRVKRLHDQLQLYTHDLEALVAERTEQLQSALDELKELDQLKSEFIANVSHELRTPLLHVKSSVHLLEDGALGELNEAQRQGVHMASAAIDKLEVIVEDIMDFSQVQAGAAELEPVSLADVCQNVLTLMGTRAQRRRITLECHLAADLPSVRADRAALARVLRHLIDNAIKFSPEGSQVRLSAQAGDGLVRVGVRDQGAGIPPHERDRIFQSFYQSDGSSTRKAGGIGLGLALVKKLLEAHGTNINLHSEPGRGTEFWFALEAAD